MLLWSQCCWHKCVIFSNYSVKVEVCIGNSGEAHRQSSVGLNTAGAYRQGAWNKRRTDTHALGGRAENTTQTVQANGNQREAVKIDCGLTRGPGNRCEEEQEDRRLDSEDTWWTGVCGQCKCRGSGKQD